MLGGAGGAGEGGGAQEQQGAFPGIKGTITQAIWRTAVAGGAAALAAIVVVPACVVIPMAWDMGVGVAMITVIGGAAVVLPILEASRAFSKAGAAWQAARGLDHPAAAALALPAAPAPPAGGGAAAEQALPPASRPRWPFSASHVQRAYKAYGLL